MSSSNDVMQIQVAGNRTGIIGLKEVLEKAPEELKGLSDAEIGEALVERLSRENYIPGKIRSSYAEAFLREFKRFAGLPEGKITASTHDTLSIKLLGPGCASCDRMEKEIFDLLSELNLSAEFEHVKDMREISRYGAMGMPALVINETIVSSGSVPSKARIKIWIDRAKSK